MNLEHGARSLDVFLVIQNLQVTPI